MKNYPQGILIAEVRFVILQFVLHGIECLLYLLTLTNFVDSESNFFCAFFPSEIIPMKVDDSSAISI